MKLQFPNEERIHISYETIYRSLFIRLGACDLIAGSGNSHIATLVERALRLPVFVNDQTGEENPTWDRGIEMENHKAFAIATDVKVFF